MPASETLRSRANPLYKRLRALKQKGTAGGLCLLEGPKLTREALGAGLTLLEAAASPRAESTPGGTLALAELRERGVPVRRMAEALLASLSDAATSQGIVALAERPAFAPELVFRGTPLVLVIDGVQDPGNLGALLRSAEAAGASGAFVTRGSADPLSWKALRGSMGSALRLPIVLMTSPADAIAEVRRNGCRAIATVPRGGRSLYEIDLTGPIAALIGGEGHGLAALIVDAADERVSIPMAAPVESLNAAVTAGLIVYEAQRQRGGHS